LDATRLASAAAPGELASPGRAAAGPLEAVIARAQDGDRRAFSELVAWHQRRVVSTAWRILGNEADALDAAQEVFLRLHRYLRSFRQGEDFSGWLYRLVVNACHDTHKKRSGHLSFEAEAARGTFATLASSHDVEVNAIVLEDERLLAAALETLSEKERAALVLRDLEGLSTQEVARILGSSATTVRSQISLARGKLRAFRDRHQRRAGGEP
jgi:RNA polymerase sigma-70 factor (ECF subfamily)